MSKTQEEFLDHFARLGVFSKVQSLMGSENETITDKAIPHTVQSSTPTVPLATMSASITCEDPGPSGSSVVVKSSSTSARTGTGKSIFYNFNLVLQ